MSNKTPGQIAYEQDVALMPTYDDGGVRRSWFEIKASARMSWERKPFPRLDLAEAYQSNLAKRAQREGK